MKNCLGALPHFAKNLPMISKLWGHTLTYTPVTPEPENPLG